MTENYPLQKRDEVAEACLKYLTRKADREGVGVGALVKRIANELWRRKQRPLIEEEVERRVKARVAAIIEQAAPLIEAPTSEPEPAPETVEEMLEQVEESPAPTVYNSELTLPERVLPGPVLELYGPSGRIYANQWVPPINPNPEKFEFFGIHGRFLVSHGGVALASMKWNILCVVVEGFLRNDNVNLAYVLANSRISGLSANTTRNHLIDMEREGLFQVTRAQAYYYWYHPDTRIEPTDAGLKFFEDVVDPDYLKADNIPVPNAEVAVTTAAEAVPPATVPASPESTNPVDRINAFLGI